MSQQACRSCGHDLASVGGLGQSRFCPQCGERIEAATSPAATAKEQLLVDSPQARGVCPACGLTDQVQNVGSVMDSESSTSTGIGAGIGTGGLGVGVGRSGSQTKLSERLTPPLPNFGCMNALIVGMGIPLILWFIFDRLGAPELLGPLVAVFGALIGVPLAWWWIKRRRDPKRSLEGYSEALQRLRSAYYCRRDDLVFDWELSGNPLAVKKHFFG